MKMLIITLLMLGFSGCAKKEIEQQIVYKDKLVCSKQEKLEPLPIVNIRVHKDDVQIAKTYSETIKEGFGFYENQVDRNNKLCESETKK